MNRLHAVLTLAVVLVDERPGLSVWKVSGTDLADGDRAVHVTMVAYDVAGHDAWAASLVAQDSPCGAPSNVSTGSGRFVETDL